MSRFILFFAFCGIVWAQSGRGTITGRITDPSDAAVANSTVTVTNQDTGVRSTTQSNQDGNYSIPQLPVGRYELTVESQGFRRYVRPEVNIAVAQTLAINVKLEVGQIEQAVEVTAAAPLIESTTSDLGTVVTTERVVDLPLQVSGTMRHPGSFVFLAPGVSGDTSNTQINGSQSRAKEILLDGIGSTSPESGGLLFTYPPVESINEFKLVSSNFNAEYGRTGGGFEVYTTRSGTNQLHGSLWEYFRNNVFDARGFIAQTTPVNRQNEFGVAVGGPIIVPKYNGKNRTFFYFVYDGFRYRAGALNSLVTMPTAAMLQGDFSNLTRNGQKVVIYDPSTTRQDASGNFIRDPFPGNMIPRSRWSAVSTKVLQFVPQPSNANQTNNFQVVGETQYDRDVYTGKLDHVFSERNRINFFIYANEETSNAPLMLPGALSNALAQMRPGRWVRLNHDYIFSPSTINNFRAGYTREPQLWSRLTSGNGYLSTIGLTGLNPPGDVLPRIQFGDGLQNWSDEVKNTGEQVNNVLQIADTVSHLRGNHSFKFGVDARWLQTNGADPNNQQGTFIFNSNETALPTAAGRAVSGNSFASFLLGQVDSANYTGLFVVPAERYRYFATFVQDDWRVSTKLTLNLGLRYEIYFPRIDAHDAFASFDPTLPNPGAGGRFGAVRFLGNGSGRDNSRRSFANTDYKNFGPRVGFAYQLNEKTVLRGGFGIFYAPGNGNAGLRSSQNFIYGFNAAPSYISPNTGVTPAFSWDGGFPANWPRPPFINPTVQNGSNVNAILGSDGRPPYFQNFQFSVQRQVLPALMLEGSYVGIKGTRLGSNLINLNEVNPQYLSLGSILTQSITSPAAVAAGLTPPYPGFTGSVAQALRPYPQYLNIPDIANPNGNSTYHAFQLKVEKRFSHGLTLLGSYTRSKTISDADIQAGGGPSGQTYYNRRLEKSLSTNDIPNLVALSYTYQFPFHGKAFGGWEFTGIQQYQSGRPVALTANNTLPLFNATLRPNVVAGVPMMLNTNNPLTDPWINPAAFTAPSGFRFGTAARTYDAVRAQDFSNESFGLIKRTALTEHINLQFRAEFFNVFNRTVFGAPQGNVSASNFGKVSTQTNNPRQGQLSLRLEF
jgi:hypothetical protein